MRVHTLQHVPFEGLGSMAEWFAGRGAANTTTRLFEMADFPPVDQFDWLVVLGGPMSVNGESLHPWLGAEKRFVREAIEQGKTVLGLCLGAQLMAATYGAEVGRNPVKEIGWWPVQRTVVDPVPAALAGLPMEFEAFHWHGETFAVPPGGVPVARSAACSNQGFVLGDRAVALQFHLETTPESAASLIQHCAEDLAPGPFVQTAASMMEDGERFRRANQLMTALLEGLASLPPPPPRRRG